MTDPQHPLTLEEAAVFDRWFGPASDGMSEAVRRAIRDELANLDAARKASPPLDVERLADDIEYALGFASHHPACRANAGNDCTCGKDEAVADGKAALDALRAALDPTP